MSGCVSPRRVITGHGLGTILRPRRGDIPPPLRLMTWKRFIPLATSAAPSRDLTESL
jgi:hypothetical protein